MKYECCIIVVMSIALRQCTFFTISFLASRSDFGSRLLPPGHPCLHPAGPPPRVRRGGRGLRRAQAPASALDLRTYRPHTLGHKDISNLNHCAAGMPSFFCGVPLCSISVLLNPKSSPCVGFCSNAKGPISYQCLSETIAHPRSRRLPHSGAPGQRCVRPGGQAGAGRARPRFF